MTLFMAMKIHYDHRQRLPAHLKYSDIPRDTEYQGYLDLFRDEGIGGEGFHECLNFNKAEDPVRIYLPPGYRPMASRLTEEFVIFSFTYQRDRELPSRIVGVHAGVRILPVEGIWRKDIHQIQGADPLDYQAEAPAELTTLLNPALRYNPQEGIYTPAYPRWGNGLRFITEENARRIVNDALGLAIESLPSLATSEVSTTEAEIEVLDSINDRYFDSDNEDQNTPRRARSSPPPFPDKELGFLGEQAVYNNELEYARRMGISTENIQWVSQVDPYSTFDIKTVRKIGNRLTEFFIEVKSTKSVDFTNVFISANQIRFFEAHEENAMFKFVTFGSDRTVQKITEFSLRKLYDHFDLTPIEYKLLPKK
jgi:hypothetical protein